MIAVRINGAPIATLDAASLRHPGYDAAKVAALLGRAGHIAFEVHDNDPAWAKPAGAATPPAAGAT